MILPRFLKLLAIVSLSLLILPAIFPVTPKEPVPVNLISYNPPPANNFHAPISDMGLIGITNATPAISTLTSVSAASPSSAISGPSIRQNALRFITDNSYFPQTETSIAVDPHNPNHILGGFNDQKFFFCGIIPNDCAGSFPASGTGFTTSADGGKTVAKSSDLPNVQLGQNLFISFGDPSVAPSTDGNFFFASLGFGAFGGNGILIAKSNSNLFNNTVSCETSIFNTTSNSCWSSIFVFGGTNAFFLTLEDKELLAVDNDPASPFYGSVYISWDHFSPNGTSASYMARCDNMLSSCVMLSGGGQLILSGNDFFPSFTTPVVDKQGNVHVAWCNYGTFGSLGPINCRMRTSPPGGTNFGPTNDIVSFMGNGTTLPNDTVTLGWATEQFRTFSIPSLAADMSPRTDNLYFTIQVCTSGHYYALPFSVPDNPGDCGTSAVIFSDSVDGGSSWSSPIALSRPAVNDQPFVTVDSVTGHVFVLYYTTQYDPFNHRIDVVASMSSTGGSHFNQVRITTVSNEPDSDPNMFNYFSSGGRGGSFTAPQYGDYFQAVASGGTLWVLFTANYASEAGTFQTDPFLAVVNEQ